MQWLQETCSQAFLDNYLMEEMVRWMGEEDFEKFYDTLCRHWEIRREECDPNFDSEVDDID